MFLKKTIIEQSEDEQLLLLGEWAQDKNNFKSLILDYHWEDLNKVEKDNVYLFNLYEKIIPFLSKELNLIHNTKYSNRFWEILVGPWFLKFIEVLYDRYYMLKLASENYKNLITTVIDNYTVPQTFGQFLSFSQNDFLNLELYSQILVNHEFDIINKKVTIDNKFKTLNLHNNNQIKDLEIKNNFNLLFFFKKIISRVKYSFKLFFSPIFYISNFFKIKYAENNNIILNLNLPISELEYKKLFKKLNQTFFIGKHIPDLNIDENNVNYEIRKKSIKIDLKNKDDFLNLVLKMTLMYMPIEYLEEYKKLRNFYKNYLPKNYIKLALIRSPVEYGFKMRFFTAKLSEKGTKILSSQEGGGLGLRKYNQLDEKMYLIGCDNFLTWGWQPKSLKAIRFFVTKTFWVKNYIYNPQGNIVLVGGSCRRYHYSVYEGHLPSFNKKHIENNINFINNLNNNAFNKLIYRFHVQMGYCEIDKVLNKIKNLRISTRSKNHYYYYNLLYNSRLVICTSDYTANLQSLMINHPTIWFWNPNYFVPRDSVKVFYDDLHEAGILYYCPIKCSKKVNEIYKDPMKWWMTEKVQKAKNNFIINVCNLEKNIVNELANIIKSRFLS